MSFLIVRSIPLGPDTMDAWRSVGAKFLARARKGVVPGEVAARYDFVINLGNTNYRDSGGVTVYNHPDTVRAISHPLALRRTLGNFIPERTIRGPHWHKSGGWGGKGTVFHEKSLGECAVLPGDSQKHVDGQEFRVITVGDMVVQAHRKDSVNHGWPPIPTGFDWRWVGLDGIRRNGIIPLVKKAMEQIPHGAYSVFGWDIMHSNHGPFVLEINTSPGVNPATAERIVNAIIK